jgi:alpha-beta hydrolase superfamily lysophospholipase
MENPRVSRLGMADGLELHVEDWFLAPGTPRRGSLMLVHGLGEHIGRYGHVARSLLADGIEVRGFDQRGFGRSPGGRGVIPHPDALLDDARLVFEAWQRDRGDLPFLLGHSMGGAIAARAVSGGWIRPRGLALSSPAIAGRVSGLQRLALAIGTRFTPDRPVPSGLKASHVSRDPAVVADYRADPLNHGFVTPRLARFVLDAGPASIAAAPAVQVPTLVLVAGADRIVDPAGALAFHDRIPAQLRTLHAYPGLFHEIFNELPADRARVLADLGAWLRETAGGDPVTIDPAQTGPASI